MNWNKVNRKIHNWGAIICSIPVLIVLITGLILLFKKDAAWIQPPSQKGTKGQPTLSFERILAVAQTVPEAVISDWESINRLDVRPSKGIIKIRAKNDWEIQIDHQSGDVLQVAYRRSDWIESIHDGSFFHDLAKYWVFLPSSLVLLILWITGMYLFLIPFIKISKRRKKENAAARRVLSNGIKGSRNLGSDQLLQN